MPLIEINFTRNAPERAANERPWWVPSERYGLTLVLVLLFALISIITAADPELQKNSLFASMGETMKNLIIAAVSFWLGSSAGTALANARADKVLEQMSGTGNGKPPTPVQVVNDPANPVPVAAAPTEWDRFKAYAEHDEVTVEGVVYVSLKADNMGQEPATAADWWQKKELTP